MHCICSANPGVSFAYLAKILQVTAFLEIIWAFVGPIFFSEASQADVWQCGEEIALTSAGEPRQKPIRCAVSGLFFATQKVQLLTYFLLPGGCPSVLS